MSATWAGASMCQSCKRVVRHKPYGGPRFALDNVSDPMVYADLTEYGTGWAGPQAALGEAMSARACVTCDQPVDRTLPEPIPEGYECMWSEAMTGRALYCQRCYDETEE